MTSTEVLGPSEAERRQELIPAYWIRQPMAPAVSPGLHRFVWDLHYSAPRAARRSYPISAVPHDTPQEPSGPLAPPGQYRVSLYIGRQHWDQPLTVLADPRVKISAREFAAQYALAQRLCDALDASSEELLEARSLRAQIKALDPSAAGNARSLDASLESLLDPKPGGRPDGGAADGSAPRPGLEHTTNALASLYEQVTAADAAPTQAQRLASERLVQDWRLIQSSSAGIWNTDLPAVNRGLKKAHLKPLRAEAAAAEGSSTQVDED